MFCAILLTTCILLFCTACSLEWLRGKDILQSRGIRWKCNVIEAQYYVAIAESTNSMNKSSGHNQSNSWRRPPWLKCSIYYWYVLRDLLEEFADSDMTAYVHMYVAMSLCRCGELVSWSLVQTAHHTVQSMMTLQYWNGRISYHFQQLLQYLALEVRICPSNFMCLTALSAGTGNCEICVSTDTAVLDFPWIHCVCPRRVCFVIC